MNNKTKNGAAAAKKAETHSKPLSTGDSNAPAITFDVSAKKMRERYIWNEILGEPRCRSRRKRNNTPR